MATRQATITSSFIKLATGLAIVLPSLIVIPATMAQSSLEPSSPRSSSLEPSSSRPSSSVQSSTNQSSTNQSSPEQVTSPSPPSRLGHWLRFFRPPTTGVPDSTGNGSSREGLRCSLDDPFMKPLLPEPNYGLTLEARPEIFVEIPQTSAQKVLLVFRNEAGNDIQRAFLPIPETEETETILGFRLSNDAPGLATGETYQWSLTFICGNYFTLTDPTVMGWVQRQEKTEELDAELAEQSPQDQLEWLGQNGYWYDLVARLTDNSRLNP